MVPKHIGVPGAGPSTLPLVHDGVVEPVDAWPALGANSAVAPIDAAATMVVPIIFRREWRARIISNVHFFKG